MNTVDPDPVIIFHTVILCLDDGSFIAYVPGCGDNILQTQPHGTMVAAKNQLQELAIAKWPLAPVRFHWRADFT